MLFKSESMVLLSSPESSWDDSLSSTVDVSCKSLVVVMVSGTVALLLTAWADFGARACSTFQPANTTTPITSANNRMPAMCEPVWLSRFITGHLLSCLCVLQLKHL